MPNVVDRLFGVAEGLAVKAPCRAATTANITLSGLQTIDGVALAANDRVLVKNQTDATTNGVYNASTGVWARATDFDGNRDVVSGSQVFIHSGTLSGGLTYYVATTGTIAIDTTSLTFQAVATPATGLTPFGLYGTRTAAIAATITSSVTALRTSGYTSAGDGGGALYKKVGAEPSHAGKFQSADGAWWELAEQVVTPTMFGAVGDGVTNDYTAFNNWAGMAAAGRKLEVPAGAFLLGTKLTISVATGLDLEGAGPGVTRLIWSAADGGIDLTFTNIRKPPRIANLSIETQQAAGGTALKITSPVSASHTKTGVLVDNVEIIGEDPANDYFTGGLHLVDCWYPLVRRLTVKGKDETVLPFSMTFGVKHTRTQVLHLIDPVMHHIETCVDQDGATFGEGLLCRGHEFVGVRTGFSVDTVAIDGIYDGHINAYEKAISLTSVEIPVISGNLILKTHISTSNFTAIELISVKSARVSDNIINDGYPSSTGSIFGIVLSNCLSCSVHDNIFDFYLAPGTGIFVGTASANNSIHGNIGGGRVSAIGTVVLASDAGANNLIHDNISYSGSAVASSATVAQDIHDNYPLPAQTLTVNSTTPSVRNRLHDVFATANTSSTTITNFTGGKFGDSIDVFINDVNTGFTHNGSVMQLKGSVNIAVGAGAGSFISLWHNGVIWVEKSRGF